MIPSTVNEWTGPTSELRRYCLADFLVIDDFAVLAMDPTQANLAFQVISERYEYPRSTCITSNRLFKD